MTAQQPPISTEAAILLHNRNAHRTLDIHARRRDEHTYGTRISAPTHGARPRDSVVTLYQAHRRVPEPRSAAIAEFAIAYRYGGTIADDANL